MQTSVVAPMGLKTVMDDSEVHPLALDTAQGKLQGLLPLFDMDTILVCPAGHPAQSQLPRDTVVPLALPTHHACQSVAGLPGTAISDGTKIPMLSVNK